MGLVRLAEDRAIEPAAARLAKSVKTLMNGGNQSLTQGIDGLNSFKYTPKQRDLKSWQIEQLVAWVNETHPAKTKQVRAYITEPFEAMKADAEPGTTCLFLEAMPLVHQHEPGDGWGDPKHPPVIPTHSGRKRLTILGGDHPADDSRRQVTGEAACKGDRVMELFEVVAAQHAAAPHVILFSDTATYYSA